VIFRVFSPFLLKKSAFFTLRLPVSAEFSLNFYIKTEVCN